MADCFIGEIRMAGFNFAPRGWALCNGQILPIAQNTALFSLLGVNFGGNGTSNFGLPNYQGAVPLNQGQGPGLTPRSVGESGGAPTVTLTTAELPAHTHTYSGQNGTAVETNPQGKVLTTNRLVNAFSTPGGGVQTGPMGTGGIGIVGGSQPHNNLQPFLAVTFIIALQGIFPQRP